MRRKTKIVLSVIALTAIILLVMFLVLRFRYMKIFFKLSKMIFQLIFCYILNPKVRLSSVSVENLKLSTSSTSPSFSMQLHAQVAVKNTNFDRFKFGKTTATISYRGVDVGSMDIVKAKVSARSPERMNVTTTVSCKKFSSVTQFRGDVNLGILTLNGHAKLSGNVRLFKVFKKKKSPKMNCTMDADTKAEVIKNLKCK